MRIDRVRQSRALPASMFASALAALAVWAAPALTAASSEQAAKPQQTPAQTQPPVEAPKAAAQAPLPSARSIIDKHLQAIGGRDAILSHTSTHAVGTLTIPTAGMSGEVEIFAAKPNKTALKVTIAGVGEVVEGFNGKNGWNMSPMSGPMLLDGKQLEEKRFDSDYYAELHDDSRYQSMITIEQTEFDGRQCYKLRLVRKGGGEDLEYYDVKTGLKAGATTTRETPMGTVTGTTVETDYKKFGNVLQPTTIRQTVMGLQQVIALTKIEYDTVPDSAFDPPAAIKALIK